jgi:queuine tRNA-ribosyltransferase
MPVATRAAFNCATPQQIHETGSQIQVGILHMLVAPGMDVIKHAGMHEFMNWKGPMLTDSGGFQVFSLSKIQNL